MSRLRYSRVLLKLSGEALADGDEQFSHAKLTGLSQVLAEVVQTGVQVGVVCGAGNLFRARQANLGVLGRVTADQIGMLATVMNAAVLRDYLRAEGQKARIFTPRSQPPLAECFVRDQALELLKAGYVVLFAGGTGNPYFTTDSAAALRALEISADTLLKGTQVDGVYDKDPHQYPDARRFAHLTYDEVLARKLGVMDLTAVTLCAEGNLAMTVFDISDPENLLRVLQDETLGTRITKEPSR
ncbi:MAG TPA: UMP kinase [Candidatus Krumholzibacteria bacterium]|nr:UMP kinase [Candidatus Krumholzibacteria bacterium]HPD71116.1 UMP kinase [Candidatus Krumholzibacteria bacterium]HRY39184.1 UMP kinase [Candidatus Krumholzibacteria bacterium]